MRWELKSYFDSKDPYNSRPNFHNYCTNTFGLSSDEMKFVHDKLNFIFKDKLKNLYDLPISRFNRLNESIENKRYLNKVLEHLVKGTKIEITVGYNFEGIFVYMPFDENPPEFMNVNDYHETSSMFSALPSFMFSKYCVKHFGLVKEEIYYVWDEYSEIMSKKFKSELRKIEN